MQNFISLFMALYFLLVSTLLPNRDFCVLTELPAMYQHCKQTEHSDMTVFDFLTDHLLNIDSFFDEHTDEDEQKPHKPLHFQHHDCSIVYFFMVIPLTIVSLPISIAKIQYKQIQYRDIFFKSTYLSGIFHPPAAA